MGESKIGQLIKRHREEKGWSLSKLSDETNGMIERSYLWRLEKGEKQNPSFEVALKLIEVLNIDLQEILHLYGQHKILEKEFNHHPYQEVGLRAVFRRNNLFFRYKHPSKQKVDHIELNMEEKEQLAIINEKVMELAYSNQIVNNVSELVKETEVLRNIFNSFKVKTQKMEYEVNFDSILQEQINNNEVNKNRIEIELRTIIAEKEFTEGVNRHPVHGGTIILHKNKEKMRLIMLEK